MTDRQPERHISDNSGRPPGRIAGIDFGTVRIGIAITDPARTLASPYENYTRAGRQADARRFRRLAEEEDIRWFIVGLPIHLSGQESAKSREAREFGQWLGEATGRPVEFFDERFTTSDAEQMMLDANLTSKRRKRRRDMIAAQVMLAAYLESSCPRDTTSRPVDDEPMPDRSRGASNTDLPQSIDDAAHDSG